MRISSRPTHRKIRKSTLAIRREKWQREARAIMSRSFARMIIDGDVVLRSEPKPQPPICQPRPSTRFGGGDDNWGAVVLTIIAVAAFLLFLGFLASR